jgi:uncharacterized damage-inducible protein DinB
MIDPEALVTTYRYNARILEKQLANVTHEQSLSIVGGYNINWLFGHLVSGRQRVLERLDIPHTWTPEQRAPYMNGSLPQEKDGPGVQRLETLLEAFLHSQTLVEEGLRRLTPEQLATPTEFPQDPNVEGRLLYLQFHETWHVGQIVLIAQALGVPGAWLN